MFLAHSFRLRDPWQCECGGDGVVRWSRVFHKPTGLEPDDALWLVCSGVPAEASVTLNSALLVPGDPLSASSATGVPPVLRVHQYEVTALLRDANRIDIELASEVSRSSILDPRSFPYDVRLGVVGHS